MGDISGKTIFPCINLPGRFIVSLMEKPDIPEEVLNYFRRQGSKGGKARARKHSKKQLSKWAKLGGRPKGRGKGKRQTKKGGR